MDGPENVMSKGAQKTLGCAGLFFGFPSLLIAGFFGLVTPTGPPFLFYIVGGLCAAAAFYFLRPETKKQRKQRKKRDQYREKHLSDSIVEMDVSKITMPGCLLFLATIGVLALFGIVYSGVPAELRPNNRREMRALGAIGAFFVVGFFLGGRYLLKSMGLSVVRNNKKKKRKKRRRLPLEEEETIRKPRRRRR